MTTLLMQRLHGGIDEGRTAFSVKPRGNTGSFDYARALGAPYDAPARTYWRDDTKRGRPETLTRVATEQDADLISSRTEDGFHAPTLDIDIQMTTEISDTKPGHRTYSFGGWNTRLPRDGYLGMLRVARDLGLVPADWYLRTVPRVERDPTKYLRNAPIQLHVPTYDLASSTFGHCHIYIDVELTWRSYRRLLEAMQTARILQGRFLDMALRRKMTLLLTPLRTKAEMQKRFGGYSS